jgi:hypothetical protein
MLFITYFYVIKSNYSEDRRQKIEDRRQYKRTSENIEKLLVKLRQIVIKK